MGAEDGTGAAVGPKNLLASHDKGRASAVVDVRGGDESGSAIKL